MYALHLYECLCPSQFLMVSVCGISGMAASHLILISCRGKLGHMKQLQGSGLSVPCAKGCDC